MVGLLSVVLVGMCAFTVDFGMAYATKRQLSTASDAAALAADMVYKSDYKGLCTVPGNDPNSPGARRLVAMARRVTPVTVRILRDGLWLDEVGPLRRGERVEVPADLADELLARGAAERATP